MIQQLSSWQQFKKLLVQRVSRLSRDKRCKKGSSAFVEQELYDDKSLGS